MILMQNFQHLELFRIIIYQTYLSSFFQIINFELSHFLPIQIWISSNPSLFH
jgi:hypothetical protein